MSDLGFDLGPSLAVESGSVGQLDAPGRLGSTAYEVACIGVCSPPIYWRVLTDQGTDRVDVRFADGLELGTYYTPGPDGSRRVVIARGLRQPPMGPELMVDVAYAPQPPAAES